MRLVLAVGRVAVQFEQSGADKSGKEGSCIEQAPFQQFHRIFPPKQCAAQQQIEESADSQPPRSSTKQYKQKQPYNVFLHRTQRIDSPLTF